MVLWISGVQVTWLFHLLVPPSQSHFGAKQMHRNPGRTEVNRALTATTVEVTAFMDETFKTVQLEAIIDLNSGSRATRYNTIQYNTENF